MRDWPELPKRVKGALWTYRVTVTDDFDDNDIYGTTSADAAVIKIRKSTQDGYRWQTFIHELVHVVEADTGVKPMKDDKDDSDVDRFAHGMLQLWLRNGWPLPGEE